MAHWGKVSCLHETPSHVMENSQEAGKILTVLLKNKKDERKWGLEQGSEENQIILSGTTPSLCAFNSVTGDFRYRSP